MPWRRWFGSRTRERDRAAEMRAHMDLHADELVGRGWSPADAAREARLRFGNPRATLEAAEDRHRLPILDVLGRDVRDAARMLRRTPAFTATAIATLALVIGANSAVFSLADAILIRALPYPQPDGLVMLEYTQVSSGERFVARYADGAMWESVRDRVPSLDVAALGPGIGGANLVLGDVARFVKHHRVSEGLFRVLGVPPARGRSFTPEEDRAGGEPVVVLSHALWQTDFNGRDGIVGQTILLRGEPHTVVGVMPAGFVGIVDADLWTPLRPAPTGEGAGTNYQVIGRLRPGATEAQMRGELHAAEAGAFRLLRSSEGVTRELGATSMQAALADEVRRPIVMLAAAVLAVLLIACVNLAALLLARGAGRSREIATRMALGSGRTAVVRQLMVEAVLLSLAGGLAGVLAGQFGLRGLKALGGQTFEAWTRASLDGRVLLVTLAAAVATSLIFGLAPAIQASRLDVRRAMGDGGSRGIAGRATPWPRRLLVMGEVALGVVLLVSAGLLLRTFLNLRALDPGFEPTGLVTASVSLQDARYRDAATINRLFDDTLRRLQASPGVMAAAVSLELPYQRMLNNGFVFTGAPDDPHTANATYVTPAFLPTLGIPLREGRDLRETDAAGAPPVALVNTAFARVYSKDRPAIGRRIRIGGVEREIVGITGDVQQRQSFTVEGVVQGPIASLPLVLIPAGQTTDGHFRTSHTWFSPVWSVRARDYGTGVEALRSALAAADPLLPISATRAMTDVMAQATAPQRLLMTLVGVLAATAVLLAAIGIHGLVAHAVADRRRELGIRMALGATAGQTMWRVTLGGLGLAASGAIAGGLLSIPATSLVQTFLWGVEPLDPATYAGVAIALLVVAGVASVLPAVRVLRLDPAETLRG